MELKLKKLNKYCKHKNYQNHNNGTFTFPLIVVVVVFVDVDEFPEFVAVTYESPKLLPEITFVVFAC